MSKSLNARITSWSKAGSKFADVGLALMLDALEEAHVHNGNIDPMKRIVATLESAADKRDAATIFGEYFPITFKDGELSLPKGWAKKVEAKHHGYRLASEGLKSFRAFAAKLRPAVAQEEKAFDLAAYLAAIAKLSKKAHEGTVPADLVQKLDVLLAQVQASVEGNVVDLKKAA